MSQALEPLTPPAAVQLPLLGSSAEMGAEVFATLEARGVYTGARLRQQRPEVYEQVLTLLREGESPTLIEEALKVDHRTVEAVARQHSIPIVTSKKRMAERMRLTAERMLDQANSTKDAQDAKNFVIAAGIADQHWQLLAGEPTSRTEHVEALSADDVNAWIHSRAGDVGAMGAAPAGGGLVLEVGERAASDSESDASSCHSGNEKPVEVDCIPESGANGADGPEQKGGRGGLGAIGEGERAPVVSGSGEFSTNGPGAGGTD